MARSLYYYVVRGFLQIFVSTFGIICNSISAVVLTQPQMRTSVNVILLCLALADNIYLLTRVLLHGYVACLQFFDLGYNYDNYYLPFIYPPAIFWNRFGQTASTYFTVAVSLERFLVVCWPLRSRGLCTVNTAWKTSAIIAAFSLIYSIPTYFEQYAEHYVAADNVTALYRKAFTGFGADFFYQVIYLQWGFPIFNFLIPFVVLIIFNTAIYVTIRRASHMRQSMTQTQKTEISIAKMLLCVVLVFGICYLPSAIYFFLDKSDDQGSYDKLFWFGFLASSVNSAVNFIIYCLMSQRFRSTLRGLWRKPTYTSEGSFGSNTAMTQTKA